MTVKGVEWGRSSKGVEWGRSPSRSVARRIGLGVGCVALALGAASPAFARGHELTVKPMQQTPSGELQAGQSAPTATILRGHELTSTLPSGPILARGHELTRMLKSGG